MAWTTQFNIKGPTGATGSAGSAGAQGPQGVQGNPGADGKSVHIDGTVSTSTNLPAATSSNQGSGYITDDTGHLWVNGNGSTWTDVGNVRGPAGPQGTQGVQGSTGAQGTAGATGNAGAQGTTGATGPRGATWFTGNGAPGTISGAAVGDFYLDKTSGDVYALS